MEELLELGNELSLLQSSDSSPASPDEIACRWLNSNTKAWEAWLPSSHLYDTALFQWAGWVISCGLCFLVVFACVIWKAKKMKENDLKREEDEKGEPDSQWRRHRERLRERLQRTSSKKQMYETDEPLKKYLSDAVWCLIDIGSSEPKVHIKLCLFFLGKYFVAASSGFFKLLLYESWLGDGLNQLSLEVTISCAALMLTLHLIEWFINWSTSNELISSGEQIVRDQLASKLTKLRKQVEVRVGGRH